jgi:hypothetical protein
MRLVYPLRSTGLDERFAWVTVGNTEYCVNLELGLWWRYVGTQAGMARFAEYRDKWQPA